MKSEKKLSLLACVVPALIVAALAFAIVGCESGDASDSLTVSPSEKDLTASSNATRMVTFTVSDGGELSEPYEWSVSDSSLGDIEGHSGKTATYVANDRSGSNVITVKDQYGSQGQATVIQ